MNAFRLLLVTLLCLVAGTFGFGCFIFSGIGICGSSFSPPIFAVIFVGGAFSASLAALLMPKGWFLGATVFLLTGALGLLVTVASQDWLRTVVIVACMAGIFAAAYGCSRLASNETPRAASGG